MEAFQNTIDGKDIRAGDRRTRFAAYGGGASLRRCMARKVCAYP